MGSEQAPSAGQDLARLEAHVTGRVQGVGFRAFVQRQAQQAGCTGYVRNSADGETVEVTAEGPRSALERLLAALRRGPRLAHVAQVQVAWTAARGEFSAFLVQD